MPQPRTVELNYDKANATAPFGPSPRRVAVRPSDTIQFRIGPGTRAAQPGCKLRITIHNGQHFSQPVLQHAPNQTGAEDLVVTVLPGLAASLAALPSLTNHVISGYRCELLDVNGQPIPGMVSDGTGGGDIVPESSGI